MEDSEALKDLKGVLEKHKMTIWSIGDSDGIEVEIRTGGNIPLTIYNKHYSNFLQSSDLD